MSEKLNQRKKQVHGLLKKNITLCILLIIINIQLKSQEITRIEMCFVKWDAKYVTITTIENISERCNYSFEVKEAGYFTLKDFSDYNSFSSFIRAQSIIKKDYKENVFINSQVKLFFGKKVIVLYFERYGDFYYQGNWYKRNDQLYVNLFNYFSNELIPDFVLTEAKRNIIK